MVIPVLQMGKWGLGKVNWPEATARKGQTQRLKPVSRPPACAFITTLIYAAAFPLLPMWLEMEETGPLTTPPARPRLHPAGHG